MATRRKRNPVKAAAALSEAFHGRRAERITDYVDELHEHSTLAELGRLNEIVLAGRPVRVIRFDAETRLASNEDGTQLFIVGGDQSLDLKHEFPDCDASKEKVWLGEVESVTYTTAKMHLGREDKTPGPYIHKLGEEGGTRPLLVYDTRNEMLEFVGGSYRIDVDMNGKYSAGIRD